MDLPRLRRRGDRRRGRVKVTPGMTHGPPPITHRHDGALTLGGYCADDCRDACQLVVWHTGNGAVRLAFHGTQRHSITLTGEQQAALRGLLNGDPSGTSSGSRTTSHHEGQ
jgi:hypothetical protein